MPRLGPRASGHSFALNRFGHLAHLREVDTGELAILRTASESTTKGVTLSRSSMLLRTRNLEKILISQTRISFTSHHVTVKSV